MEFEVELLGKSCGTLKIEDERFSFAYLESYVATQLPPISVVMPLREEPYSDKFTFAFFENLLPEGQIRRLMAEQLKTTENNFSRLLESVGGDVAGAIRILPKVEEPSSTDYVVSLPPKKLSKTALGKVLEKIEVTPFLVDQKEKLRLSLAGAQNKLPVIMRDDGIYITNGHPSTHIIKPPSPRFSFLVENEYICMRSARKAGLNVPEVSLVPFIKPNGEEHECLVIERYDRIIEREPELTKRIHQEDVCQIMSVPSSLKYAKDGGPGYAELFESVRQYTTPSAVYQNELLRRIVFNILIGNNDAHGKNFSLLHANKRNELAPAYDLVATEIYEELDSNFAMPFGEASRKEQLDDQSLTVFEEQTRVNLRRQKRLLQEFVSSASRAINSEILGLEESGFPDTKKLLRPLKNLVARNESILSELLQ